jgi:GGDEF domain-containing protein
LIEEQLRRIIRQSDWALMDIRINHFDTFKDVYGFMAGDDVLRFTAMLMGEVLDEHGTSWDFIGHSGEDSFILITSEANSQLIRQAIKTRFAKTPLMDIAIGTVSPSQHQFADIREITELASEARRTQG